MTVTLDNYRAKLAVAVSNASRFEVYHVPPKPNWWALYLYRMNIVALDRNNTLDVLTDEEIHSMTSFLELNL